MKLPLFLGLLLLAASALAAPPASVTDMAFTHAQFERRNVFYAKSTQILLNADGTYTGLWAMESSPYDNGKVVTPRTSAFSIPPNGTWTYRVTGDQTAELIIDRQAHPLQFYADPAQPTRIGGNIEMVDSAYTHSFTFSARNTTGRIQNTSTRSYLAPGRSITLGFVVSRGDRPLLVRVIGPGLRSFGIVDALPDPVLNLTATSVISGLWESDYLSAPSSTLTLAAQRVGAFPLPSPRDIAKLFRLNQGAYTLEITAASKASSGEVLIEIYQLP